MNSKKNPLTFLFWPMLLLVPCSTILAQGLSASQTAHPPPPLVCAAPKVTMSFQGALEVLAAQGKIALIAEGRPLHPVLPLAQAPDLSAGLPLEAAAAKIARAYGYEAHRVGGVFEFQKLYDDPRDLPPVTLMECRLALQDVVNLYAPFNPHISYTPDEDLSALVAQFVSTLTPDQYQIMLAGKLRFFMLSDTQQRMMRNFVCYSYVQSPSETAEAAVANLAAVPKSVLMLKRERLQGVPVEQEYLGYQKGLPSSFVSFGDATPVLPAQASFAMPPGASAPQSKLLSLGTLAGSLSRPDHPVVVDPALADKPVTAAGLSAASPSSLLHALADVYGLRFFVRKDGAFCLSRPAYPIITTLTDLPGAIRSVLPLPLLRRQQWHPKEIMPPQPGPAPEPGTAAYAEWQMAVKRWVTSAQEQSGGSTREATPAAAVRQAARACLLALLKAQPSIAGKLPQISVASLPEAGQEALAVALTSGFLDLLNTVVAASPPSYIAHMDQDSVQGKLDHDTIRERLTLNVEYLDVLTSTTTGAEATTDVPSKNEAGQ